MNETICVDDEDDGDDERIKRNFNIHINQLNYINFTTQRFIT